MGQALFAQSRKVALGRNDVEIGKRTTRVTITSQVHRFISRRQEKRINPLNLVSRTYRGTLKAHSLPK
jgi:hypothetical protein